MNIINYQKINNRSNYQNNLDQKQKKSIKNKQFQNTKLSNLSISKNYFLAQLINYLYFQKTNHSNTNRMKQEKDNNVYQEERIKNVDKRDEGSRKVCSKNKIVICVIGTVVIVLQWWVVMGISGSKIKRKYEDVYDVNGRVKQHKKSMTYLKYQGEGRQIQQKQIAQTEYFHFRPKIEGYRQLHQKNIEIDKYQLNHDIQTLQKRFSVGRSRHVSKNNVICHQKFEKFILGVRLTQVTNNVNYFGQVQLQNYDYYKTPKEKYENIMRTLTKEKQYVEKKYQISKYINNQIRFCVVIASRNNAITRIYLRNLNSIFQQEYDNYHIVYFDDASTDNLSYYIKEYIKQNRIPEDKLRLITNKVRKGGLDSFYKAGHEYCQSGEIMAFVDGDDVLIGRQVFSLLNAVYQKEKVALTYGSNLQYDGFQFTQVIEGYKFPNAQYRKKQNLNFYQKGLLLLHMKTMYVDLFRMIDKSRIQFKNGSYLMQTTDVAIYEPLTQLAGDRIKLIEQLIYQRTLFISPKGDFGNQWPSSQVIQNKFLRRDLQIQIYIYVHIQNEGFFFSRYQNLDNRFEEINPVQSSQFQGKLQEISQLLNLSQQQRYKPLKQMKFADNPIIRHYEFK